MPDELLLVFLKAPVPGRVKTRLAKDVGAEEACRLYREMASEALRLADGLEGVRPVACYELHDEHPDLAWADAPELEVWEQAEGDLGERLSDAFRRAFEEGALKAAAIGADAPGLPPERLRQAFDALEAHDLVLGPARDGGFYLVGLKRREDGLFRGIPWSTGRELDAVLERAGELGLDAKLLPPFDDVDDLEGLKRWKGPGPSR